MNRFYSLLALLLVGSASLQAQSDPFPDHTIPAYKYQGSMQCTSQVVMNGEIVTDAVVAAYCGDDFRGKNSTGEDPSHPNHVYLTIYGDYTIEKQYIHFKVYMQGKIFTCNPDPAFVYTFNGIVGSTSNPYIIDITPVSLSDNGDNTDVLTTYNRETCDVVLTGRSLTKDGNWNTLCLPFSMDDAQIAASDLAGATIKELNATTSNLDGEGVLTLNFTTATSIVAGKPYIIKWDGSTGSVSNPVFTGVTISSLAPTGVTSTDGTVTFIGTYSPTLLPKNETTNLYMGANSTLYYPNVDNFYIRSFRAYFRLTSGILVKGFVMNFDEDPDAIGSVHSSESIVHSEADAWFDLNGRKLAGKPTQPGIYLNNGRKQVIK